MRGPLLHTLIASLCLLFMGMDIAVHSLFPLMGRIATRTQLDGGAHANGHDSALPLTAHDHDSSGDQSPPLDDHDVSHHLLLIAQKRSGATELKMVMPPVLAIWVWVPVMESSGDCAHRFRMVPERPSKALSSLRTVIMNV
jgi:hypothetical protein